MSGFLENAQQIFEVANAAQEDDIPTPEFGIVITSSGGLMMVSADGWSLASLQEHYGGRMAYRVTRKSGRVRVQGRSGSRSCVFESEGSLAVARRLLNDRPLYYAAAPRSNEQPSQPAPNEPPPSWWGASNNRETPFRPLLLG